jgi:aspartate kinase
MGKTTNRLLAIAQRAAAGDMAEALRLMDELRDYHLRESPPGSASIIDEHFRELAAVIDEIACLGQFPARLVDVVSAFGERLSSRIVALAFCKLGIEAQHVDSREVIITDRRHTQAAPLYTRTYARLSEVIPPIAQQRVVVMGGFIASTPDGVTTTLGRGGSDFTAAIVGAGIGAEEIQIWTDVDGILTCDPRIHPGGRRVKTISFQEAAELAYFGAKVLHPATVIPAVEKNVPVLILNSRRPEVEGTRLVNDRVPCSNIFKSIACKPQITVVEIQSARMLMAYGFLRRIFEVFDRYKTPVDMVTTSEVAVSLTIDNTENLEDICEDLRQIAEVSVSNNQAIVCLVGDRIRDTPGIGARVFGALKEVNVRMISQGASLLNLSLVVASNDLKRAVEALHHEFFSRLDPAVFD